MPINSQIVQVQATVAFAATPSTLQQSGALVSVGGTTASTGTATFYGNLAAVTTALSSTGNFTELSHMATTYFAQGTNVGVYVLELGVVASPAAGVTALSTWIAANPGQLYAYLTPATWDVTGVANTTITAGGSGYTSAPTIAFSGGAGSGAAATAVITGGVVTGIIITNPGTSYTSAPTIAFSGGGGTGAAATATLAGVLNAVAGQYASPNGETYFFGTAATSTTLATYPATKSLFMTVTSPTAAAAEFQAATAFAQWLNNAPSAANPMVPMNNRFVFGVTPWALTGSSGGANGATITTILTAFGNVIITGAEGGISNSTLRNGTTMDGNQAMFWWAVDYALIQSKILLANAVINGSNGAPISYNQFGINTLEAILNNLGVTGVANSIFLAATFTATSFAAYTNANPSAYAAGLYGGFKATITPQLGFTQIQFFLTATTFT